MSTISRVKTWSVSDTLTAADLNAEFNNIVNDYNGSISNVNIASDAAIAASKLDLTKPNIKGSYQALTTTSYGATTTFNCTASNVFSVTLAGNPTLAVSNVTAGQLFVVRLIQDATGSRTVTWWSGIKWPSGTAPTLTTTANSIDVFAFLCTGAGAYDGYFVAFDER